MSYYKERKEEILDKILDTLILNDPYFIYNFNIESLHEISQSESINAILADIEIINKDNEILNTNFIQNQYNQLNIKNYFKAQGLYIKEIPDLIQYYPTELLGAIFFSDFNKIFEIKRQEYVRNNYLYNDMLLEENILNDEDDSNDENYFLFCRYPMDNRKQLNIYVRFTYATNTFCIYLDVYHPEIDFYNRNTEHNSFEEYFTNQFKLNFTSIKLDFEYQLNRFNIEKCSEMILNEINKYELTNEDIFNVIKNSNPGTSDLMSDFLKRNLTKKTIEESFYPISQITSQRIPEHRFQHNRATYNFESVFIEILMHDMKILLPDFIYTPKSNKLKLSLKKDSLMNVQYLLEIFNNKLTLFSDGFFVSNWVIRSDTEFKESISQYIDADIHRYLKIQEQQDYSIENKLKNKLDMFLDHKDITVSIPPLSNLPLYNILNSNIPVYIQSKNQNIKTNINFSQDFADNEELTILKEKMIISDSFFSGTSKNSSKLSRL